MGKTIKSVPIIFLLIFTQHSSAQTSDGLATVHVNAGERTLSKLPIIIAKDQGIFERYGLDVDIRLYSSEFQSGVGTEDLLEPGSRELDFIIEEHSSNIIKQIKYANSNNTKAIAAIDCNTSAFIIGNNDASLPYNFKAKRIGVGERYSSSHYIANFLAKRNGLDSVYDFGIILNGHSSDNIEGRDVDVVVMSEINAAVAIQNGNQVLEDTFTWNEPLAGSSIIVNDSWLDSVDNYIKAKNFIMAIAEAMKILHNDKSLALSIFTKWYGIEDQKLLEFIYARIQYLPKTPHICVDGIESTLEIYKSNITDRYTATDFYDDRFVRELDDNGFFDSLYK